eukprot:GHUV01013720.1.p1 GENE.GHUV01013720.1~~GHUV01013720.1.p1  ORF type:complete len:128 (+),score=7.63 GHUV01013720.1:621-1004(+)
MFERFRLGGVSFVPFLLSCMLLYTSATANKQARTCLLCQLYCKLIQFGNSSVLLCSLSSLGRCRSPYYVVCVSTHQQHQASNPASKHVMARSAVQREDQKQFCKQFRKHVSNDQVASKQLIARSALL